MRNFGEMGFRGKNGEKPANVTAGGGWDGRREAGGGTGGGGEVMGGGGVWWFWILGRRNGRRNEWEGRTAGMGK
jgi:hypothetical protein